MTTDLTSATCQRHAICCSTGLSSPGVQIRIEHRLFSQITMNWRGRPLSSHEAVVELIGATRTRAGLTVHAELDTAEYPTGVKVPDKDMHTLIDSGALTSHDFHGDWNYTLKPRRDTPEPG